MIDRAFRPDPRAKLALLLLWAVAVFLSPGLWFEALLMLLSVALGIALGKGRLALGMLGLYAVMMACMLATAQLDTGVLKNDAVVVLHAGAQRCSRAGFWRPSSCPRRT